MPLAVDRLIGLIRASSAGDPSVKVTDGFPRFSVVNTDLIAVGGKAEPTASGEQTTAALGNRRREERYTIRVACSSSRGGDDQKAVRDRAFALMALVETGVRDDPTLGGAVMVAQIAGSIDLIQTDAETAPDGVFAEVSFDVSVQARI